MVLANPKNEGYSATPHNPPHTTHPTNQRNRMGKSKVNKRNCNRVAD